MDRLEEITQQLDSLEQTAQAAVEKLNQASTSTGEIAEFKALLQGDDEKKGLIAQIETLSAEREQAMREVERKAMQTQLTDLQRVIEELRKPSGEFLIPSGEEEKKALVDVYGRDDADYSLFQDIRLANRGDAGAKERLTNGFSGLTPEGKAMTEGTDAQGGYLVRPVIERQLVLAREQDNVMRQLCSQLNINTNGIQLDQLTLSTVAGWVAELAQKPESTAMTLASLTANVFTAAGLVTVSNQLLADSNPAVDQLALSDLKKRLVALEEAAFIGGSGSGQPLGILNTPGIASTNLTSTVEADLVDSILLGIGTVETDHKGGDITILMHPRTWTRLLLAKVDGAYLLNPAGPGESAITGARTLFRGPQKMLWGYPVVTSNSIPATLGGGTNETRVVIGDFKEALILDRQGVTVDESTHAYFTTNQTVFRAEERVGFTAARSPQAFHVIGGTGLARG